MTLSPICTIQIQPIPDFKIRVLRMRLKIVFYFFIITIKNHSSQHKKIVFNFLGFRTGSYYLTSLEFVSSRDPPASDYNHGRLHFLSFLKSGSHVSQPGGEFHCIPGHGFDASQCWDFRCANAGYVVCGTEPSGLCVTVKPSPS